MVSMELNRRDALKALGGMVALGGLGGGSVTATKTDGKAVALEYLANDDILDNEELRTILRRFEKRNPDRVSVTTIGTSNQGRPICSAAVGNGDTDVMAIAQQHGDEYITPEGMLAALKFLTSDDDRAESLLNEVTVHLVPRVNPDGFVARQRYNVDTDAPERGESAGIFGADAGLFTAPEAGIGWDINRYHWFDWSESNLYQASPDEYPENPVPEARAIDDLIEEVDPHWIIDFHRQGEYVVDPDATFDPENPEAESEEEYPPDPDDTGAGTIVTGSLFWPINEGVSENVQDLSKQVVSTIYDELTEFDQATYSRYPGGTYAGIARNAFGLSGRGSVLFELSAGTLGDREFRIRQVFEGLVAAVEATADDSLYEVDPDNVEELPERESNSFTVEGESRARRGRGVSPE